ncbi:hypothetical protein [Amycolatopsis magusensis]|uniref:hypothetical protein n=1 Tax=Amycolatopsis magusensis TaxID=882444 RepID=UPI0037B2AD33
MPDEHRIARTYTELGRAMRSIRITEADPSGAVRITVDAQGKLLDVVTTGLLARLPPERVGEVVLDCVRRAQARIPGEVSALAKRIMGGDDAEHIATTLRGWFPDSPG